MKVLKRDVAGHFCDAENLGFFMHSDICDESVDDPYTNTKFCVSLIGEWRPYPRSLNVSGRIYELAVFDKQSKNPWSEIERFCIDDKTEAIEKFKEIVKKYKRIAEQKELV